MNNQPSRDNDEDNIPSAGPSLDLSAPSTSGEPGLEPEVRDFLNDENEDPVRILTPVHTSSQASLHLARVNSELSVDTVILADKLCVNLVDLCTLVTARRSLRGAEIRMAEQYRVWTGKVFHRFLILELHRNQRRSVWLRLDRHRGGGLVDLVRGVAPALDQAILSADKECLTRGAEPENKQSFEIVPTLGELSILFGIICQEMTIYTAWPENCYLFCSLIQEHLGAERNGVFLLGKLTYAGLAPRVRERVYERVCDMYHIPPRFTLARLFNAVDPEEHWPLTRELLTVSVKLDRPGPLSWGISSPRVLRLCGLVLDVIGLVNETHTTAVALNVFQAVHEHLEPWREATRLDFGNSSRKLPQRYREFLGAYRQLLNAYIAYDDPCDLRRRNVALARELFDSDVDRYRESLGIALQQYGIALRNVGKSTSACNVGAEAVKTYRALYASDMRRYRSALASSLHHYGRSLQRARRFSEACNAGTEAVAMYRSLYAIDGARYIQQLSSSLLHLGLALTEADRSREACDTSAENIHLVRVLYLSDAEKYREMFARYLYRYAVELCALRRFSEACDASARDVELGRTLAASHAAKPQRHEQYRKCLSLSLSVYAEALHGARRLGEACDAALESFELMRTLPAEDTKWLQRDLALAFKRYGVSLRKHGEPFKACDAGARAVKIYRSLDAEVANRYRRRFCEALEQYGISLCAAERFDEACDAYAEKLELRRAQFRHHPNTYRYAFSSSLLQYGTTLLKAWRFVEACDSLAEAVKLHRVLYAGDPTRFSTEYLRCLEDYYQALRVVVRPEALDVWKEWETIRAASTT